MFERPLNPRNAIALVLMPPLLAVATGLLAWLELPADAVMAITRENGPIELPTALLWFALAFGIWHAKPGRAERAAWVALSALSAAFGARELDLHKAWTSMSILKSRFYLGEGPLAEKLIGLAVIGSLAAAGVLLLKRYGASAWRELAQRTPWSMAIATFVSTLLVAKLLDRAIYGYGLPVSSGGHALVSALEELLELSLPIIGAVGFALGLRPSSKAAASPRRPAAVPHRQPLPATGRR